MTGGLYDDNSTCKPYNFPPCNHHSTSSKYESCADKHYDTPDCHRVCNKEYPKSYNDDKTFGNMVYRVDNERRMMKELVENGPFEVALTVYEDFLTYKSGVY